MPVHDWTRVDAGLFHAFHHFWITTLCDALNRGGLPGDYFAHPEQRIRGPIPDVLTLELSQESEEPSGPGPGLAVAAVPPRPGLSGESKRRPTRGRRTGSAFDTETATSSLSSRSSPPATRPARISSAHSSKKPRP